MKPLTDRQQTVLAFVEEFCERQGYPPTVREVAAAFGIQPRAAVDHLAALRRKGYLHREPGLSRGLSLTARSPGPVVEVPLLGRIEQARAALQGGDLPTARQELERLLAEEPGMEEPRLMLATVLFQLGEGDQATTLLQEMDTRRTSSSVRALATRTVATRSPCTWAATFWYSASAAVTVR